MVPKNDKRNFFQRKNHVFYIADLFPIFEEEEAIIGKGYNIADFADVFKSAEHKDPFLQMLVVTDDALHVETL